MRRNSKMIANDWIQIFISLAFVVLMAPLVGRYLAWIYQSHSLSIEKGLYRLLKIDADKEMTWKEYGLAIVVSNGLLVDFFVTTGQGL